MSLTDNDDGNWTLPGGASCVDRYAWAPVDQPDPVAVRDRAAAPDVGIRTHREKPGWGNPRRPLHSLKRMPPSLARLREA